MSKYIKIEKVMQFASAAAEHPYSLIKGKKIMFESVLSNGESIILCTPQAGYQPTVKACWVDITKVQCRLMESSPNAIIIFRLDGEVLSMVNWCDLKPYLTEQSMRYSDNEKEHWKLHIDSSSIKVTGNSNLMGNKSFKLK